jgi:hypothetical protein
VVKVTFRDQSGGARPASGPGAFPLGAAITLADLDHDPHPWLARLRDTEPVSWLPALHGWLVTRHDLAVAVMRDSAAFTVDDPRFSTARVVGPSMLSLDGAAHGRHRTPFTKGWRHKPPSAPCSPWRNCASIRRTRPHLAGWCSASRRRSASGGPPDRRPGHAQPRRRRPRGVGRNPASARAWASGVS